MTQTIKMNELFSPAGLGSQVLLSVILTIQCKHFLYHLISLRTSRYDFMLMGIQNYFGK